MEWESLSEETKGDIFKYLKLMKIFTANNSNITSANKKWMLEHCDLPTELVPLDLMGRFWL